MERCEVSSKLISEIIDEVLTDEERQLVAHLVYRFWDMHYTTEHRAK